MSESARNGRGPHSYNIANMPESSDIPKYTDFSSEVRSLPAFLVAFQPPAGRIPIGHCVLGKEGARTVLVRRAQVVVLGFVSLERRCQIPLDRYASDATSAQPADFKDRPVEDVEDRESDHEPLCGFSKDSHAGWGAFQRPW
jgi:hypothetical protein